MRTLVKSYHHIIINGCDVHCAVVRWQMQPNETGKKNQHIWCGIGQCVGGYILNNESGIELLVSIWECHIKKSNRKEKWHVLCAHSNSQQFFLACGNFSTFECTIHNLGFIVEWGWKQIAASALLNNNNWMNCEPFPNTRVPVSKSHSPEHFPSNKWCACSRGSAKKPMKHKNGNAGDKWNEGWNKDEPKSHTLHNFTRGYSYKF